MNKNEYVELTNKVRDIAAETHGPDRHVVTSLAYLIEAFSELDSKMQNLDSSIKNLNRATSKLMWVQIFIAVTAIVVASAFTIWSVQQV